MIKGFCLGLYRVVLSYFEVDTWDALWLLHAMKWATDLQLLDMDFEVESNKFVDSIYRGKDRVSDFGCRTDKLKCEVH